MGPRLTVVIGLTAGAIVALAIVGGAILLLPDPQPAATASIPPGATPGTPGPSSTAQAPTPSVQVTVGAIGFHVGEPAPDLSLGQLGGGQVDLAALKGKPVWINFMQTTCPPCVDEFPLMSGFAARYEAAGLVVVAVDIREDEGTVASFVRSLNAQFPVGLDADGTAAQAWGVTALPVHFWVDRDGIIRAGAIGGIGPDVMATNLSTILPGVVVTP